MNSFEVVKQLHAYLVGNVGTAYNVDIVTMGKKPQENTNIKMFYQMLGYEIPKEFGDRLKGEQLQLTFTGGANNYNSILTLKGCIDKCIEWIDKVVYKSVTELTGVEIMRTGDPITINYNGDGFLPRMLINIRINYY